MIPRSPHSFPASPDPRSTAGVLEPTQPSKTAAGAGAVDDRLVGMLFGRACAEEVQLTGENIAAQIVADLATQILTVDDRLKQIDKQIRATFHACPQTNIIREGRTGTSTFRSAVKAANVSKP